MTVAVLVAYGTDEAGVRALIRATARTSLVLFLAAFTASSLQRLWPTAATAWLMRNRRFLGLSFAVSHFIHLGAVVTVAARWPHPFMEQSGNPLTVIGGGAGYVGLALMALTSFDGAVKMLGAKRWRTLHLAGSWLLSIIFLQSYAGRALGSSEGGSEGGAWFVPHALALVAAAVVRALAWRRRARARASAS